VLIPLEHGKILVPSGVELLEGCLRLPRTAVQHNDHRICLIVALNIDPLIDSADSDEFAGRYCRA